MTSFVKDIIKFGGLAAVVLGLLVALLPGIHASAAAIAVCSVVLAVVNGVIQWAEVQGVAGKAVAKLKTALGIK